MKPAKTERLSCRVYADKKRCVEKWAKRDGTDITGVVDALIDAERRREIGIVGPKGKK